MGVYNSFRVLKVFILPSYFKDHEKVVHLLKKLGQKKNNLDILKGSEIMRIKSIPFDSKGEVWFDLGVLRSLGAKKFFISQK